MREPQWDILYENLYKNTCTLVGGSVTWSIRLKIKMNVVLVPFIKNENQKNKNNREFKLCIKEGAGVSLRTSSIVQLVNKT